MAFQSSIFSIKLEVWLPNCLPILIKTNILKSNCFLLLTRVTVRTSTFYQDLRPPPRCTQPIHGPCVSHPHTSTFNLLPWLPMSQFVFFFFIIFRNIHMWCTILNTVANIVASSRFTFFRQQTGLYVPIYWILFNLLLIVNMLS